MRAVWSTVVTPVLEACRPETIVEVGGGDQIFGEMLEQAARELDATVVRGTEGEPAHAVGPDLAFVYGEPNWYSVTEGLERLAEMAAAGASPFPVTLVHEVDWPTGRRDSYPDPSAIPVGARQPHEPEGGTERALDEHDQRNGVMTAVEDFLMGNAEKIELIHVPGLGGTAVLVSADRLSGRGSRRLAQLAKGLRQSPQALAHLAAIDADRAKAAAEIEELSAELESAQAGLSIQASAELDLLRDRVEELAARQAELKEALARREARLAALEADGGPPPVGVSTPEPGEGDPDGIGDPSQPLPLDRHRILLGEGEDPAAGGVEPVNALVRMTGDADRLRLCLWSLLDRADRPLRLTLVLDDESSAEARGLARAVAAAEPRVRVVEGDAPEQSGEWTLRVDAPVEFFHGTLHNLMVAAGGGTPRPTAAVSADAIGVPDWAGADCLALLLGDRTREIDTAGEFAAACVALPPGAAPREGPAAVALDAAIRDGAQAQDGSPPGLEWLAEAFAGEERLVAGLRDRLEAPLSIAYVLPGLPAEGSGGSHSVFQEALALRSIGVRVRVLVEGEFADRAAGLYPESADLIHPYRSPRAFAGGLAGFDVIVATEAPSARLVDEHVRAHEGTVGAYYIQDYEPLFSPEGGPSSDQALLSYRHAEGLLLFAKTHWIANVVAAAHRIPVAKVSPSLDQAVFHPRGRRTESTPFRILAMVRPRTPRRRPAETLSALARIKREMGDRVECLSFGCDTEELQTLPSADGVEHLGSLTRTDVAEVLRRCDVFLDLSAYQAFGRTGLEAMACGTVPLLPTVGGATEYAVDGRNSLLVDTADEDDVVAAVTALAADTERLGRLRANGLETAGSFTVTRAAVSQYACFAARHGEIRGAL